MRKYSMVLFWSSKIIGFVLLTLLLMLSFDVFDLEESAFAIFLAFLIHNIPFFILLVAYIIAWKKELIGAVIFFIATTLFIIFLGVNGGFEMIKSAFILIFLSYLTSLLHFFSWRIKNKRRLNGRSNPH